MSKARKKGAAADVEKTDDGGAEQSHWIRDFLASLVVFLVALPLCIGIAVACGVPAEKGIITGIVGGIAVGAISGSPLLVSGPAASLIVLVNKLIADHGMIALAPVVMLAGVWQMIAGVFGLGQWFRAVAPAVIKGMLIGIGVLIFGSQLHVAVDADPKSEFLDNILTFFPEVISRLQGPYDDGRYIPILLGVATVVGIVGWERVRPNFLKLVPGHLVSLASITIVAAVAKLPIRRLDIAESFFDSVDIVSVDQLSMAAIPSIIGLSFVFAFVASAATLLTAAAIDSRQSHTRTQYDKEMLAQGIGNTLAGAVGGLPMTGVIVRSSVNVDAGARTRASTIFHGIWLLGFVAVAPQLLEQIPRACLGAILVYTGYKLIDIKGLRELYARGPAELGIALITLGTVVFVDLFVGILLGLGAALAKLLYTFSHLEVKTETNDSGHHIHLAGSATFVRLPVLAKALEAIPEGLPLHLHVERLEYIDHACLELLAQARKQNSSLRVEWDEIDRRHDPAFRMERRNNPPRSERQASVLSVLWQEWRRLYARPTPTEGIPRIAPPEPTTPTAKWFQPEQIRLGLKAESLDQVVAAAAEVLAEPAGLEAAALAKRLQTGRAEDCVIVAEGVGLPHVAVDTIDRPLIAVVTTAAPVVVGGDDVDVFFVLLAPQEQPREHLVALAHIGRICHDAAGLADLRDATEVSEAQRILESMERQLPEPSSPDRVSRVVAVLTIDGGAENERALLALLEEGHPSRTSAQAVTALGPVAKLLGSDPDQRVATVVLEEEALPAFRRLVVESALVLGCEVQIRVLRIDDEAPSG